MTSITLSLNAAILLLTKSKLFIPVTKTYEKSLKLQELKKMSKFLTVCCIAFIVEHGYKMWSYQQQTILKLSGSKLIGSWDDHRDVELYCGSDAVVSKDVERSYIAGELKRMMNDEWNLDSDRLGVHPHKVWIKEHGCLFGIEKSLQNTKIV